MPDGQVSRNERQPLLWVALGRQRVGKTALLNTAVQYFRGLGSEIEVWNADQQNRSHTLSTFFDDATIPPHGGVEDAKRWIEQRLFDQVNRRFHAVLDAGGGWTGFSSLIDEVPIIGALGEHGIDVIGLFCVGPEKADLDYLDHFAESEAFLPKATVIVLNAGLVLSGRSAEGAFASVLQNRAMKAAMSRGARVVMMPSLACMSEVTDRGITFADAAEGRVKPGQEPLSVFDPLRVREWWSKKIPVFFGKFPPDWLPVDIQSAPSCPVSTRSGGTDP